MEVANTVKKVIVGFSVLFLILFLYFYFAPRRPELYERARTAAESFMKEKYGKQMKADSVDYHSNENQSYYAVEMIPLDSEHEVSIAVNVALYKAGHNVLNADLDGDFLNYLIGEDMNARLHQLVKSEYHRFKSDVDIKFKFNGFSINDRAKLLNRENFGSYFFDITFYILQKGKTVDLDAESLTLLNIIAKLHKFGLKDYGLRVVVLNDSNKQYYSENSAEIEKLIAGRKADFSGFHFDSSQAEQIKTAEDIKRYFVERLGEGQS